MAAVYHNHVYRRYGEAESAGTKIPHGKNLVKEVSDAQNAIEVMKEEGIDISHNRLSSLSPEMIVHYDRIICMAEFETCPDFLRNSVKVAYWEIEDAKGKNLETTRKIREHIKRKINEESKIW